MKFSLFLIVFLIVSSSWAGQSVYLYPGKNFTGTPVVIDDQHAGAVPHGSYQSLKTVGTGWVKIHRHHDNDALLEVHGGLSIPDLGIIPVIGQNGKQSGEMWAGLTGGENILQAVEFLGSNDPGDAAAALFSSSGYYTPSNNQTPSSFFSGLTELFSFIISVAPVVLDQHDRMDDYRRSNSTQVMLKQQFNNPSLHIR
jgi:hypothetical protein